MNTDRGTLCQVENVKMLIEFNTGKLKFARYVFRDCGTKIAGENVGSLDCSFKQYTNELSFFWGRSPAHTYTCNSGRCTGVPPIEIYIPGLLISFPQR